MHAINICYSIIFLPLITSLFCQIFSEKILPFSIALITCITIFAALLFIYPTIQSQEIIANDFNFSKIPLALEFKIDKFAAVILLLLIFFKTIAIIFYKSDINKYLDERNNKIFYSVFLLNIFALVGIFTTNNIFNLFLFIEIFNCGFFAISSISRDKKLLKSSFEYFTLSAAASLLTLFSFLIIYLVTKEVNFDKIATQLSLISSLNSWFLWLLFGFLTIAFIIRFFPLWIFFRKIKSASAIADFLNIDTIFIKGLVGIFLTKKFMNLFFANIFFANSGFLIALLIAAIFLILYSAAQLLSQRHLRTITAYYCLNNLACIFAASILQAPQGDKAIFFYLLNFILVNLFLFIFAGFLRRNALNSSLNKIWMIEKNNFLIVLPFKFLVFFIAGAPFSLLFFANWNLMNASFALDFRLLLLITLFFNVLCQLFLATKIISAFYFKNPSSSKSLDFVGFKKYNFYMIFFWMLLATVVVASVVFGFVML